LFHQYSIKKKIIGYFASTCHVVDVGGIGWSAEGKSFFEEGTLIPVSFLRKKKSINESLLRIITANSRVPNEARGDILSLMSCNDAGINRLIDLLKENSLTNLSETSSKIIRVDRISMKKINEKRLVE
jgi:N-methylhydantoinase B/oxoprolinase/acetone carboxylase alpha subunit